MINKIREMDLDSDLLAKILGNGTKNQQDFVNNVNSRFSDLDSKKQNKADMVNFFSKSELIPKANLDKDYVKKIDDNIAKKVNYDDLESSLRSRITNYEDGSKKALSECINLQNSVSSLQISDSSIQQDINNIYNQIANLQTSTGSSETIDVNSIQTQINNIRNSLNDLDTEVSDLQKDFSVKNVTFYQLDSTLQEKINSIDRIAEAKSSKITVDHGRSGMSIVAATGSNGTPDGVLKPAYPTIFGHIISGFDSSDIPATGEYGILFDKNTSYVYVLKNGNNAAIEDFMELQNASIITKGQYQYAEISDSDYWLINNKFIIDEATNEVYFYADGTIIQLTKNEKKNIKTGTINAGASITISDLETGNTDNCTIQAYVLDNDDSTSRTKGMYIDAEGILTIASNSNAFVVFNDTDNALQYKIVIIEK